MSEVYTSINGNRLTYLRVHVGNIGPWYAECDLDSDVELSGQVTINIDSLSLIGTVDLPTSGIEGGRRRLRVLAGAGGWGKSVDSKSYHNDAQVKAKTVAEDAARSVGETIGSFIPSVERIGIYYIRKSGLASQVIEDVLGGNPWYVDYDGITKAGPRPITVVDSTKYEVLAYNPKSNVISLSVSDASNISVGSQISKGLDTPKVVREVEIVVDAGDLRVTVWCGGGPTDSSLLPGLMSSIIKKVTGDKLFGKYKYRVSKMSGDRVDLEIVNKTTNLPNIMPVPMWPGVAGVHCELTPGTEVLVEFIDGNKSDPIITHFSGKDGKGFIPVSITLGGPIGSPVARQGDTVEVLLPPMVFSGTIGGSPATGVVTATLPKAIGSITGGSSKVKAAT